MGKQVSHQVVPLWRRIIGRRKEKKREKEEKERRKTEEIEKIKEEKQMTRPVLFPLIFKLLKLRR